MSLEIKYLRYLMYFLVLGITLVLFGSLTFDIQNEKRTAKEYATIEANASYNKDLLYRRWAAMHGGVYVPVSEETPPNPHLSFIKERDVTTPNGQELTLMNPAYMTRQVFSIAEEQYGVQGHITSLNPLRPENMPDLWEHKALSTFEAGETEYFKFEEVEGELQLNYMSALFVEERCLKCHESQGYSVGELRGGISVSVPMSKYLSISKSKIRGMVLSQLSVYLLIIGVLFFSYRRILAEMKKSKEMRLKLVNNRQKLLLKNKEYHVLNEKYRQQNEDLNYAIKKAEHSDKLKTAFLQNMSHEIRTPVNAIKGFSALLRKQKLTSRQRTNYLNIVENSSGQLLSVVNDILTISSIETDQELVHNSSFCLNQLMEELFMIFQQRITNKNIELQLDMSLPMTESTIYTDRTKLTQILSNLLGNSVKFTASGFIHFGYKLFEDQLEFFVQDTGIGISKDQQVKVFERFHQGDSSASREFGGTGLGLSISKAFVELLSGKIWIISERLKGTEICFRIPYVPKTPVPLPVELKLNMSNISTKISTVLIAEDELHNFLLIKEILENRNVRILHAKNGKEAIRMVQSNKDIDLIMMDIKMPLMDGHTATLIIKEGKPKVPVIAVSAYALDNEVQKFNDVFEEYITKPYETEKLLSLMDKYLLN